MRQFDFELGNMKIVFFLLIIIVALLVELALSKPTPLPQYPFTVLPKKGKGHRRRWKPVSDQGMVHCKVLKEK